MHSVLCVRHRPKNTQETNLRQARNFTLLDQGHLLMSVRFGIRPLPRIPRSGASLFTPRPGAGLEVSRTQQIPREHLRQICHPEPRDRAEAEKTRLGQQLSDLSNSVPSLSMLFEVGTGTVSSGAVSVSVRPPVYDLKAKASPGPGPPNFMERS